MNYTKSAGAFGLAGASAWMIAGVTAIAVAFAAGVVVVAVLAARRRRADRRAAN
jgi:hypothetical protein